ncbi:MAG: hypothetical protein UU24_C0002G0016 [Candidatus Nomurabacteria bacterium GW2011_GWA2_40_9]|uniref:Uncharacterized protein n=1 Tax=Candidatus Nomurabacteria bacterium GW2011_GWA2_40_9 TaxID=1618734 RepID=A0A0G0W6E0_9BACT|nr:MAG: hypothetical protein UU24_C0002G0016 [Candidatus Nomurabacteria bacterium GW2011_GWA2_40_9]
MDPESKKLLEETHELVEENNEMLRKIRSVQKKQAFFQIVHWVFVIGVAIGTLYFLEPYITQFQSFIKEAGVTIEKFKSFMPR